jgi:hypothetical protein
MSPCKIKPKWCQARQTSSNTIKTSPNPNRHSWFQSLLSISLSLPRTQPPVPLRRTRAHRLTTVAAPVSPAPWLATAAPRCAPALVLRRHSLPRLPPPALPARPARLDSRLVRNTTARARCAARQAAEAAPACALHRPSSGTGVQVYGLPSPASPPVLTMHARRPSGSCTWCVPSRSLSSPRSSRWDAVCFLFPPLAIGSDSNLFRKYFQYYTCLLYSRTVHVFGSL